MVMTLMPMTADDYAQQLRALLPTGAAWSQEPDAVLIYAGHNEYYGALGVGSTESLGRGAFDLAALRAALLAVQELMSALSP